MPRGPLPDPHAARRNAPAIPTTELPADGRPGPAPAVPTWCELGRHGREWWAWAWSTPEAAGWSGSLIDVAAQRASLVDDLNALARVENLSAVDAFDMLETETAAELKDLLERLVSLATGRLAVIKAMAPLDQQLGFGAKNLAALRWTIKDSKPVATETTPAANEGGGARSRLRVVGGGG